MSEIIALVQARYTSTRLPGKVLMKILGTPMIVHQLERIKRVKLIDQIILATSSEKTDDKLAKTCEAAGFKVFRGDLENVLDRFICALKGFEGDTVVRLTGDCPLIDPIVINDVIAAHLSSEADYTSNSLIPTFPDGLDVEVFKRSALQIAHQEAFLPSHLEHATPFIYSNPERFVLNNFKSPNNLAHLRWTVDEPEDFEFVTKVYKHLYSKNKFFTMEDIIELLQDRPELSEFNSHITRNEGYEKSLKNDKQYLSDKCRR